MTKKRAVGYRRVSTNEMEQENSFEMQKNIFKDFCSRHSEYEYVGVYQDQGKSGTKIKGRTELNRLLADAKLKKFDVVLVKDVSRLSRNIKDFMNILSDLTKNEIEVKFISSDMSSRDANEGMLVLLAWMAEQESANTSKRIRISKEYNAKRGRVPNLVYGYDKTKGELFDLAQNEFEAEVVKFIFEAYLEGYSEVKIAKLLNEQGIMTKRNCRWSQNAINRILQNELYTGTIINSKEEMVSFKDTRRQKRALEDWKITKKESLRIISDEMFEKARLERIHRASEFNGAFKRGHYQSSHPYPFTKMIKCKCCGYSFRRMVRPYKGGEVRWVCSYRNAYGADSCPNKTVLLEEELLESIRQYLIDVLSQKDSYMTQLHKHIQQHLKKQSEALEDRKSIQREAKNIEEELSNLLGILTTLIKAGNRELFEKRLNKLFERQDAVRKKLSLLDLNLDVEKRLTDELKRRFDSFQKVVTQQEFSNEILRQFIDIIEVDENGEISVKIKSIGDLTGDESVLISDNRT